MPTTTVESRLSRTGSHHLLNQVGPGGGLAATTRDWGKVALLRVAGVTDRSEQLLGPAWVEAADVSRGPFACADGRTGARVVKTSRIKKESAP